MLWASTSTKNPAYPDTLYVEELIGPDTVNTMPEETIGAYQDHGDPQPRLEQDLDEAHALLERLAAAGVDYDDVTDTLEREGVEKFSASFEQLLDGRCAEKLQSLAAPERRRLNGAAAGSPVGGARPRVGDRDQHHDPQRPRRERLARAA